MLENLAERRLMDCMLLSLDLKVDVFPEDLERAVLVPSGLVKRVRSAGREVPMSATVGSSCDGIQKVLPY